MEDRRQYAIDRQARLIELLKKHGYCSVAELSSKLAVSPMTIRRDLHVLTEQQITQMTHGGARLAYHKQTEPNFHTRSDLHRTRKQAIGRYAATLIDAGDVIGIDAGSTAIEVARNLPVVPLNIVTYSFPVAATVAENEMYNLVLLGGQFHHETLSFTGSQAVSMLHGLRIHKLFLAASGLLIPDGLSSSYLFDVELKQALVRSSRQVIVCMDSSKIGQVFLASFASLSDIHMLVTDSAISTTDKEALERCNIRVMIAPLEENIPVQ
jgi:DeoR/GlpR family transcriptional regulator of sugar metabolism